MRATSRALSERRPGGSVPGGPGANHLGFTYSLGDNSTFPNFNTPGKALNRISGAAVFAR